MRRLAVLVIVCLGWAIVPSGDTTAQRRGPTDWMTSNGDAQRSSWVRYDAKISRESMQKPGFQLLWKQKLNNQARGLDSLTPPSLLDRLIGYRGFRMLAFVGGSSDRVFAIDSDLGRMEWERSLVSDPAVQVSSSKRASLACSGGMTAGVTRPTGTSIAPGPVASTGGGGRSNPARSAVGEPGMGAVTLALVRPSPPAPPPNPSTTTPSSAPARINLVDPPGGQLGSGPFLVYALSSDGMLHSLHMSNGANYEPPVRFLPPNADAQGLIVVNYMVYIVTRQGCDGVANGVWALDLASKKVATWKSNVSGLVGPAFGADGTLYVATASGGESQNSLVALDPMTLSVKSWYSAEKQDFSASPVIFEYKGRTLIAAPTREGSLHLLDTSNLGGTDHRTPLATTRVAGAGDFVPGALSSWQDTSGTRWILVPTNASVVAWKIVEKNGAPSLEPGWTSRDLVSPLPPTIINGVVFVTSSGEYRSTDSKVTAEQRAARSSPAVLYALDGLTGKELWNSGTTITSFTRGAALSGGVGQIYLGTHAGNIYAFGFPMEH